jgi:hypothetical protein
MPNAKAKAKADQFKFEKVARRGGPHRINQWRQPP